MPFEWWEEMLPYMLSRIEKINTGLKIPGSLNFLTNLMIRDERYFDLFNEYADHPCFCLYTSWEPDTRRFGTRNKLFPKFLENMDKLRLPRLILDVIMTQEICDLGGRYVAETFIPHGVTDFSCKMLSPFGSGKAFFEKAMVDFASMSRFLEELDECLPEGVTYTPSEESLSSLYRGTSFQCNGNFYYDLSVEPDGLTHFNANQTADERVSGGFDIHLSDPDWARKVVYGNTEEAAGKLGLHYPECRQCPYLRFCNGGWWHYKSDQEKVAPFNQTECAGLKSLWDRKSAELQGSLIDMSLLNHRKALGDAVFGRTQVLPKVRAGAALKEGDLKSLDDLLALSSEDGPVDMYHGDIFDRTPSQRILYYDALGIEVRLDQKEINLLAPSESERLLSWQVNAVLSRALPLDDDGVLAIIKNNQECDASKFILDAAAVIVSRSAVASPADLPSGLIVDARNDEMFRWLLNRPGLTERIADLSFDRKATPEQKFWIETLRQRLLKERETFVSMNASN